MNEYGGIVRRIDELGRIVIPKEIRRNIHLREGDPMEIIVLRTNGDLILKKYNPAPSLIDEGKMLREAINNAAGDFDFKSPHAELLREAGRLVAEACRKLAEVRDIEKENE